jgi:signal transduction histidine kinase
MKRLPLSQTTDKSSAWPSDLRQAASWLAFAAWLLLAALGIGLAVVGVPARFRELVANTGRPLLSPVIVASVIVGLNILLAGLFIAAALWIVRLKRRAPLALFLSLTLIVLGVTETGITGALINPQHGVDSALLRWLVLALGAMAMAGALLLLYTFPSGQFVPRWTRLLALVWVALNLLWLVHPQTPFNPLNGPVWRATPAASFVVGIAWFATGLLAQGYRYHRVSDLVERQQTKWTMLGLAAAVTGGALYYGILALAQDNRWSADLPFLTYTLARPVLQTLFMALLPICLVIAIMRYHLFDVDLILHRALVYGALTGLVIAIYVAVVGALSALFGSQGSLLFSLAATGLVAVAFQPLRERVQRAANRLVYGERDEPYAVLARLGQRLEATAAPETTLETVVETIAQALKIPYAAIALHEGVQPVLVAEYPCPASRPKDYAVPGSLLALPLSYQGELAGQLRLAPRAPDLPFSVADRRLLEDVARHAGVVVHAVRLQRDLQRAAADLQLARERLVTAREEERRRLRRDLHDGLGPSLASLTFKLDAARSLFTRDPDRADALLSTAADQMQTTVAEIRRLVYNLRPPALDQLGLAAALAESAGQVGGAPVVVDLPPGLPPLPAAVEVAAYRIAQEALTNVARHAQAQTCWLQLRLDGDWLVLEIRDDGRGLPDEVRTGVGLHAMQERAAELGGVCTVESGPAGTVVLARLPLYETR